MGLVVSWVMGLVVSCHVYSSQSVNGSSPTDIVPYRALWDSCPASPPSRHNNCTFPFEVSISPLHVHFNPIVRRHQIKVKPFFSCPQMLSSVSTTSQQSMAIFHHSLPQRLTLTPIHFQISSKFISSHFSISSHPPPIMSF